MPEKGSMTKKMLIYEKEGSLCTLLDLIKGMRLGNLQI